MKNIGIITFHFPHNVGAVLQCVALQKKIQYMGATPYVIDYRPKYHTDMYKAIRNPFLGAYAHVKAFNNRGIFHSIYMYARHFISICISNLSAKDTLDRENKFNIFINENLNLTKRYTSNQALRMEPPKCDIYICGSDQIWNSDITNGCIDDAYYLNFGNEFVKRVAYAPSAQIKSEQLEEIIKLLKKFELISVREIDSQKQLMEAINKEISVQVDPTLLLERSEYKEFEKDINLKGYILFYGLKTKKSQGMLRFLKKIREYTNLPVVDISANEWKISAEYRNSTVEPGEFLGYIKNASYVVTNSFHGTVFSLMYHVPMWCFIPSLKGTRISNLLIQLGLENRIIEKCENVDLEEKVDFTLVDERLSMLRKQAEDFLMTAIWGK